MTRLTLIFDILGSWLIYGALAWLSILLLVGALSWWFIRRRRIRNRERRRAARRQARRSGR